MSQTLRGLIIAVAVVILIAGCTSDDRAGVEPTRSPDASSFTPTDPSTATPEPTEADYLYRIKARIHAAFFDGSTPAEYRRWEPRLSRDDGRHVTIVQRRLPGCDTPRWLHLEVDQGTRDFAYIIRDTGTGFVVARQLTVYDDAAAAKQFVPQMTSRKIGCGRYAGHFVETFQVSDFNPDRFVGITANHDGTVFSQGYNATNYQSANANWVDIVTRENNAVALTRITDLAYEGNPDVLARKSQEQRFVAEVRRQGTISARTLNAFK